MKTRDEQQEKIDELKELEDVRERYEEEIVPIPILVIRYIIKGGYCKNCGKVAKFILKCRRPSGTVILASISYFTSLICGMP